MRQALRSRIYAEIEASEPCSKAESGSQPTHNKRVAGLSATVPEVQIPDGVGRQQIANVPRRCFWRGVPQNVQQNSPGHLNRKETQKPLQYIEKLYIARLQQTHPLVQMRRQRETSEPLSKAESGSQLFHNKCIAGLSATAPEVQIPDGLGTPQNANALWRCFRQGYPPNSQQNSPGI